MTRPPPEQHHAKGEIDRAGAVLALGDSAHPDFTAACAVARDWRNAHAYPLNAVQTVVRKCAEQVEQEALVSQRLKRLPSIRSKLERNPKMQLSRIQDLGGCRAILGDCTQVRQLEQALLKSRWKHELVKVHDYLASPKPSGYRGIHMVYRYRSERFPALNGLQVEIQLRSRLQHAWATAVETIGIFLGQSLKSSQGESEWLDFFALVSSAFAVQEGETPVPDAPPPPELHAEIKRCAARLDVVAKLGHFSQGLRHAYQEVTKNRKAATLVLHLNTEAGSLTIWNFAAAETIEAEEMYSAIERSIGDHPCQNVVLVSVSSIRKLREAYPNYFLDTKNFLHELNQILGT